jgi:NAD(P)-dependent dehydrogenase (short-subunit alcohol dehydrogenase family)
MEKVALITGIRRIGKEIAQHLIDEGWSLSLVYRGSKEVSRSLEERGNEKGVKVLSIEADLSDPASWGEIVDHSWKNFGRLDAFIHLASPYDSVRVDELTYSEFENYMRIITGSFLFMSQRAYNYMLGNEGEVKGRIIAFGDWAVETTPYRGYSHYFVSKGALHTAVRVLAKEFAPHVLVNCVAPGPVIRPEGMKEEYWEGLLSRTPLKREVPIRDLIRGVNLFLETSSITGEVLRIDSGRHIAGSGIGGIEG